MSSCKNCPHRERSEKLDALRAKLKKLRKRNRGLRKAVKAKSRAVATAGPRASDLRRELQDARDSERELRVLLLQSQKSTTLAQEALAREQEAHATTGRVLGLPSARRSAPKPPRKPKPPRAPKAPSPPRRAKQAPLAIGSDNRSWVEKLLGLD